MPCMHEGEDAATVEGTGWRGDGWRLVAFAAALGVGLPIVTLIVVMLLSGAN